MTKEQKKREQKLRLLKDIHTQKKEELIETQHNMLDYMERSQKNDVIVHGDLSKQMDNIMNKINERSK